MLLTVYRVILCIESQIAHLSGYVKLPAQFSHVGDPDSSNVRGISQLDELQQLCTSHNMAVALALQCLR